MEKKKNIRKHFLTTIKKNLQTILNDHFGRPCHKHTYTFQKISDYIGGINIQISLLDKEELSQSSQIQ